MISTKLTDLQENTRVNKVSFILNQCSFNKYQMNYKTNQLSSLQKKKAVFTCPEVRFSQCYDFTTFI